MCPERESPINFSVCALQPYLSYTPPASPWLPVSMLCSLTCVNTLPALAMNSSSFTDKHNLFLNTDPGLACTTNDLCSSPTLYFSSAQLAFDMNELWIYFFACLNGLWLCSMEHMVRPASTMREVQIRQTESLRKNNSAERDPCKH